MPIYYYDDFSGNRTQVTLKYYDDFAGNRITLSGNFRLDDYLTPAPGAPALSLTSVGSGTATLSWTAVTGATAYTVRTTDKATGAAVSTTALGNVLTTTVSGLTNGTAYSFTVTATVAGAETAASNVVSGTPSATSALPTAGTLSKGTVTATTVVLNWTSPTGSSGAPVTSQTVYVRTGSATGPIDRTLTQLAADTTVTVGATSALTTGTTYYFTVTATNSVGESAPSNSVSATPTGGNPGSTTDYMLGMYPGTAGTDAAVKNALGQYPMIGSIYYQVDAPNVQNEGARMASGMHSHSAIAPIDNTGHDPAGSRNYIAGLVEGTSLATNLFTGWFTRAQQAAVAHPNQTLTLFPIVEPEVHFNQGHMDTLLAYLGNSTTAVWQYVGKYCELYFEMARDLAPACLTGLWFAGYSSTANNTNVNTMMSQITTPMNFVGVDPYLNGARNGKRPWDVWAGHVNAWRVQGQTHYNHWVRLGSPPIILTETGISHNTNGPGSAVVNTDAEMAAWISLFFDDMKANNISRVVYFNSDSGSNGDQAFIGSKDGTYPQSIAAFSSELTATKGS